MLHFLIQCQVPCVHRMNGASAFCARMALQFLNLFYRVRVADLQVKTIKTLLIFMLLNFK